jgi:cardiolipin synthase
MAKQFFVLPDDGLDMLLNSLRTAQHTIDIYVFTLSNQAMIGALSDAVGRGVTVRAVVEPQPSENEAAGQASVEALSTVGVQVHKSPDYYPRLHAKSFVVDSRQTVISSGNFLNDWTRTRDYGVLIDDPAVVAALAVAFDADWRAEPGTPPPALPLVLSPPTSRAVATQLIAEARQMLLLEEEQVTDPDIVTALAARANAGVQVHLVTNAGQGKNTAPLAHLQAQAPAVQIRYSRHHWMHAKLLIADGQRMLVGSVNLTPESLDVRREVSLLVTDPAALTRAVAVAQADFAGAAPDSADGMPAHQAPADSPGHSGG